jgi:hypothetical protein
MNERRAQGTMSPLSRRDVRRGQTVDVSTAASGGEPMDGRMVGNAHVDAMLNAWVRFDQGHSMTLRNGEAPSHTLRLTFHTATRLGQKLLAEHRSSVKHRYNKDGPVLVYRFAPTTEDLDPVVILKLITYYEHLSSGHRGWETSAARKFCDSLRSACIRSLPGYDAAPWTIDDLQEVSISSRPTSAAETSSDTRLEQGVIEWGALVLTLDGRECVVAGRALHLTYMEYELLRFLATQPGKVFTRDTLLNRVWGYEHYGGARTVDVHIRRLRAKLGHEHAHLIETVRSVGYRFGHGDHR